MTHIIIALDENYFQRAEDYNLLDSLYYNKHPRYTVKLLCIDFKPKKDHRFESATCKKTDLKSYREGFPKNQKNRKNYVCAEGGEFLDYFDLDDDDKIIHIDADMLLQRQFSEHELSVISKLRYRDVGMSYASIPPYPLKEEAARLNPTGKKLDLANPDKNLFCAGLIAATVKTYREIIYHNYQIYLDSFMASFDHHAAGQLLMNDIVHELCTPIDLGYSFHHGDWLLGSEGKTVDNKLVVGNNVVLFNHHKFNKTFNYK